MEIKSSTFASLTSLIRLDLSDNNLKTIGDGFFTPLLRLEVLDLSDNKISEIRGKSF